MRSSPDGRLRDVLVIFARSCTGLKNLPRYDRKTVSAPIGHRAGDDQRGAAPEHEGGAERDDDRDDGREQRLDAAGLERRVTVGLARLASGAPPRAPAGRTPSRAHGLQPLLHDGHDVALALPDLVRRLLDRLLEAR